MLESSLVYIITRTFPESLIVTLSGMILLGNKIEKNRVLRNGLILGVIVAFIRFLPINFGVHSILSMIAVWIILFKTSNKDVVKSMISTFIIWISLAISEGIYILLATSVFNVNITDLTNNSSLKGAILTLPSLLIMFLMVLILKYVTDNTLKFKVRS